MGIHSQCPQESPPLGDRLIRSQQRRQFLRLRIGQSIEQVLLGQFIETGIIHVSASFCNRSSTHSNSFARSRCNTL